MIEYIEIKGFKSIKEAKIDLRQINILIGANGVGKSNFVSFFKLIGAIFNQRLQRYVIEEKADNVLFFGRKTTEELFGKLIFRNDNQNNNGYHFTLAQTKEGGLFIAQEASGYKVEKDNDQKGYNFYIDREESVCAVSDAFRNKFLREYIQNQQVFHFHDTSSTSYLRRVCDINDNRFLRQDGRNLPAFLYYLQVKEPVIFKRIVKIIQSVAPYIDRLILEPGVINEKEIELRWVDKGDLSSEFSAYQLSDGTLRFKIGRAHV